MICQYTQRQSNNPSVQYPASHIERLGAKVAVIAYSASPYRRMGGGRNFRAAIISNGMVVPQAMPCTKRKVSSRSRSWMKGRASASRVQVASIHSSKRRSDSVMANHAANGMAINSPALYTVVSQEASSRPKPSAPRTSASANAPTRMFNPAIMAARKMPTRPAMARFEDLATGAPATGTLAGNIVALLIGRPACVQQWGPPSRRGQPVPNRHRQPPVSS
ncbi:hypothetical protein D3C84_804100 [compost metagenome]